ncbi:hypothetical protein [Sessilibacter corallicola]|uniref:hypothetical protein n=1 Tax=Sessilibacter corallicola TaxID=2904075 RepID=UPI001E4784E3|nr:hypothetical protein [Sessilibacter corallicola]MCE2027962.1 hypothetical protein [Sessilibacter corallicola]
MSTVYLLQNQNKFFFSRQGLWVSGKEPAGLYRVVNKDEAINEIFEISARDFDQRITVVETEATEKGVPIIDPSWISELPEPTHGEEPDPESDAVSAEPVAESDNTEASKATDDELALTLPGFEPSQSDGAELDTIEKEGA